MFKFQRHADDLMGFYQKRYKVKQVPQVIFKDDKKNSQNVLGSTGQYDPHNKVVTIFVTGRHGKDVLRSLAHELIHHLQNERGDLANIGTLGPGYAQKDDHMRNMEREAYEQGNLCLRDWEDQIKTNNIQLYETIYKADKTKGDPVMSLKEQRNVNFHNKLMQSWGFSKKDEESVLLNEQGMSGGGPTQSMETDVSERAAVLKQKINSILAKAKAMKASGHRSNWSSAESANWRKLMANYKALRKQLSELSAETKQRATGQRQRLAQSDYRLPVKETASENIEEGAGVGLTMDFIDGWKGGQKTNDEDDEDEGDDEENTQALKTNHPNDPGNRTKYNKKVEETIRKTIRNILKEIM